MKAWFADCRTVEEAKARYRALAKEHHPDHGGDAEVFKEIGNALEAWLRDGMRSAFRAKERDTGRGYAEEEPIIFADVLRDILDLDGIGRIEVIGYWIYAFDSYDARAELAARGFWFSGKHKAWIYSGDRKRPRHSHYTTDQLRERWGFQVIEKAKEPEGETLAALPA